jgi:hypothetical protein
MRTVFIVLACLFLAGCAEKVWDKPGGTDAELKRTWAACQMGAAGMPQPAQQAPNPSTYTGNTTCYGNSCTTTVTPGYDSSALANSMSNLGHALAKQRYLDNCLIANGWTEYDKGARQEVYNPKREQLYTPKIKYKEGQHAKDLTDKDLCTILIHGSAGGDGSLNLGISLEESAELKIRTLNEDTCSALL